MKRSGLSILLLVAALVLLAGSVVLYQHLSQTVPETIPVSTFTPAPMNTETPSPAPATVVTQSPYPRAVDFTFTDGDGNLYKLSDLYGKPTIINFFATWCPPCRAELPAFDAAYQKYGDRINFVILDSVDSGNETVLNGLDFVANNGYSFPIFFDTLYEGYSAYGTGYIPETVIISADGGVVDSHTGGLSEVELQSMIDQLLNS